MVFSNMLWLTCGLLTLLIICGTRGDLIIKLVDRKIDVQSALMKITTKVTLENTGVKPENHFYHLIHSDNYEYLAYLEVVRDGTKLSINDKSAQIQYQNSSYVFEVELDQPLGSKQVVNFVITELLMNKIKAYPVEILQKDNQLVKFFDNLHYFSPYKIVKESVLVSTGTKTLEHYSKLPGVTNMVGGTQIRYGNFENLDPLAYNEFNVHYENHSPFLLIRNLKRIIEVSHWGNIAVEEHIEMVHSGAQLKGPFSRYEYMMGGRSDSHCVKSFTTVLPKGANKIYYRDMNGNISTSNIKVKKNFLEVELHPRFPLFGGWKTKYILGYNIASNRYLFRNGNQFLLRLPFVDHVHNDMQIANLEVSIRLPVGANNVKVTPPYDIVRREDGIYFNYMDSIGRTVLNFEKKNVVENHIQSIEIEYDRNQLYIFYEPILISGYIFSVLIVLILFLNMNFSLTNAAKDGNPKPPISTTGNTKKHK